MMDEDLRRELLELRRADEETRTRLVGDVSLFDGYAPEMERVHRENAERLAAIMDRHGWPGSSLAGEDGAEAAWSIAQHAISRPAFQRRCLELLQAAVEAGEAPSLHEAYLTDRIRFNERRPQVYGTIFDWDADGRMSPWDIEYPDGVEDRRAAVGLPPLAEHVRRMRAQAGAEGDRPPADFGLRQREIEAWARSVGWL
jgi:hypothetical protein